MGQSQLILQGALSYGKHVKLDMLLTFALEYTAQPQKISLTL